MAYCGKDGLVSDLTKLKPINELTPAEINREIAERTGQPWHELLAVKEGSDCSAKCSCGRKFKYLTLAYMHIDNPDFYHDPRATLRVMEGRKNYFDFINTIGKAVPVFTSVECYINTDYITEDGLLAKASLEWMRSKNEG